MAYPAQKLQSSPNLRIIEGGKNKNNKFLIAIILLVAFMFALLVLNNIDNSSDNETVKSAINWDNPPCSPKELSSEWEENTHYLMKEKTPDRRFINNKTGEVIEFHPYNSKGEYKPHWHRINPNKTNRLDYNFDKNGKTVKKGSPDSHIYTNC